MALSHPIGDMITRIRNGQNSGREQVSSPYSKLRIAVLKVLKEEGFISDFTVSKLDENRSDITIYLVMELFRRYLLFLNLVVEFILEV